MSVVLVAKMRLFVRQLLTLGESLSHRVVHARVCAFALRTVERLFGFARTVVLARLLSPKDFGLFGIAILALSALDTFSQIRFEAALIQKKDDVKPYLNTAWTVQIIREFALAAVLAASAPLVAGLFGEPRAVMLLRVLALFELAKGFTNIGVVFFQKELEFHKQFFYMLAGSLADFAVAICGALLFRNAWALAYGLLAGNAVRMAVSFLVCPYRPRPRLEATRARELYSFGRWIFESSILVFLLNHGDDVLAGKVLGAAALGLYQMAYAISNLPTTEITHVVCQVMFPACSKFQDQLPHLRNAYLQVLQVIAFVSFPVVGGIVFLAPAFVRISLRAQWVAVVPTMQALAVWGLIRSLSATTGALFQATGHPDIAATLQLAKLILLGSLIYPFTTRWGVLGTAAAVAGSAILVDPLALYIAVRIARSSPWEASKVLILPALTVGVTWFCLFVLRELLPLDGLTLFIVLVVGGATVYLGLTPRLDYWLGCGLCTLLKERVFRSIRA